jgi:hypothetical protein
VIVERMGRASGGLGEGYHGGIEWALPSAHDGCGRKRDVEMGGAVVEE